MSDFFEDFKPIRNKIRKLKLEYCLEQIRIEKGRRSCRLVPEVIEFLYVNCLIYAGENENIINNDADKIWRSILIQTNKLMDSHYSLPIENNVIRWFHASYLNQLKCRDNNYIDKIYRYYYIFSRPNLDDFVSNVLGVKYKDFVCCSVLLYSYFKFKNNCMERNYYLNNRFENTSISKENMSKTIQILSISLENLKCKLKDEALSNNDHPFITYDYSHVKQPIIEYGNYYFCLYHEYLLSQLTSGIYYIAKIYERESGMSNYFGSAFEDYVGLVLDKNKSKNKLSCVLHKEYSYTVSRNNISKTSDWIIETDDSIVFFECKTKRLKIESKSQFVVNSSLEVDLNEITKAVKQLYVVYSDYINGKIDKLKYNSSKRFVPIVITLEEWYAGISDIAEKINVGLKCILRSKGFDTSVVDTFPFKIYSIENFEYELQYMFSMGFDTYFKNIKNVNVLDELKKDVEIEFYFKDEFMKEFIEPLNLELNIG